MSFSNVATPTTSFPYSPPTWAGKETLQNPPKHGRLSLASFPTPIHHIETSAKDKSVLSKLKDINLYIKRDDMSGGVELGGNKIRKLEFLLSEALAEGYDSVVTIGGEQSNHCRATAAAARMVGLEPHLILRSNRVDEELGSTGNIMFDRLMGSTIYTCTRGEYGRTGSDALVKRLCAYLRSEKGKKPYPIPVGGSNPLGTWGYIRGVDELMTQLGDEKIDHIVFACGSGGTATGITLGIALANTNFGRTIPKIHAVGVCDSPDYFFNFVPGIAEGMGMSNAEEFVRAHLTVHQGKGLGYAASTPEELEFCTQFSLETGIVLDPVYSGKAFYHFITNVVDESFRGSNVLFWHTGGSLGMYDKVSELNFQVSPVHRLDVYGKGDEGMIQI